MTAALAALALTLATPVRAEPVEGPLSPPAGKESSPSTGSGRTDGEVVAKVDAVARRYGLAGEVLVARGDRVLLDRGYGTIRPDGGPAHEAGARWRLASITKQVTAALIVREYRKAGMSVDRPIPGMDQANFAGLTMRHLLQHHSGLANPDDTPSDAAGVPSFYRDVNPDLDLCVTKPAKPGAAFSYNNCDYWIAAGLVGFGVRLPDGMALAQRDEVGVRGYIRSKPEPRFQLAAWGPAGGLVGTARAVFDFDRSLMTGKLLPAAARDELWKPEGNGSYQALGAWVFPGRLAGCATPKRIVQRDGEIYGVQARNFILPDDDLVAIIFTNRSADDFAFGEVWQGSGFAYDLLSAAAC